MLVRSLPVFLFHFLQMVTIDNVEEYIDLVMDFCLNVGIHRQMEALKGQHEYISVMDHFSVSKMVEILLLPFLLVFPLL